MTTSWAAWRCTLATSTTVKLKHHSINQRQILLVRCRTDAGDQWCEASPLPGWSQDTLLDNQKALIKLQHQSLTQATKLALPPALSSAIGLLSLPHQPSTHPLSMNYLILDDAHALSHKREIGTEKSIKLKVGQKTIEQDIQRITALLTSLPAHSKVRLDANQSWTYDDIEQLSDALNGDLRIDYIEEPLLPELSYEAWPNTTTLAFAHDERLLNTRFTPDPNAKALVLKPTLLGWHNTIKRFQQAKESHAQIVISSSFESPLGLKRLEALARHWNLTAPQGLSTGGFFNNTYQPNTGGDDLPLTNLKNVERVL